MCNMKDFPARLVTIAFLSECTQPVVVAGNEWAMAFFISGGPHGAVLGLPLVLTFISDLPDLYQ